jgi:hypothetical protein
MNELLISIDVRLSLKGDDQSNLEDPIRNNKHILLKDIQTGRTGARPNILDLNKEAN